MRKSIFSLGAILSKQEQKQIQGGHHTCAPQYTQQNCDEYCGSLEAIIVGAWNGESTMEAGEAAAAAYDQHCGGAHSHPDFQ